MTNQEIRAALEAAAEPDYRAFSARLLPGVEDLLGVRLPTLRKLARRIARDGAEEYLARAASASFEERLLQGLALACAPMERPERVSALERFLPRIDNWSVCDSTAASCRFLREEPGFWLDWLIPLAQHPDEYRVRFAIVCLLDHFIEGSAPGAERVLDICARVRHEGYYARMANAWAIAECAVYAPESALALLKSGRVDAFTREAAIRKACESLRVPEKTKAQFRALRRKRDGR